ncbi:MAG: hypothetical protein HY996_11785 [Micrococcales bacterium]|nr:hypothetical protein [Micrococcales bacterium]
MPAARPAFTGTAPLPPGTGERTAARLAESSAAPAAPASQPDRQVRPDGDLGRLVAAFDPSSPRSEARTIAVPATGAAGIPATSAPPSLDVPAARVEPPREDHLDRRPRTGRAAHGDRPSGDEFRTPAPALAVPSVVSAGPRREAQASTPDVLRLTPTRIPDPRTTAGERIAFALAIVVAPVGLLASVGAAALSARRRGWVPGLVSAGVVLGSVLTAALGAGAVVVDGLAADAVQERAAVAGSQPMCRAIRVAGLDPTGSDFGWPTPGDSIASTLTGVQAYTDRWSEVSALAPSAIKADAASIVSAATEIRDGIAQSRTIDDAGNTTRMQSVRARSALPAWTRLYCG